MEEALDWLKEEFACELSKLTLSRVLSNNYVSHKRLKFVAAQRDPGLRVDYLMRVESFSAD